MSAQQDIRPTIHGLLRQQQLGVLSTVGEGAPYASLIAYAVSDDDRRLYFVTPRATRKFANLSATPNVALLVNSSINRPEDFHRAMAVTATGLAQPVSAAEREGVINHYLAKHPYLEEFARSPSCELVVVRVERYILVQRFQNVTEYRVEHDVDHTP
jgi:nitroimidazol reductase NimA-like FMN-containing flavoprotein (pyridoxamine 5'-phosphate oxidase superfamily)